MATLSASAQAGRVNASGISSSVSPVQRFCLWIYIFAFAFDFKGNAGGTAVQGAYVIVAFTAFFVFMLSGKITAASKGLRWISTYWWIYLATTVLTAMFGSITDTLHIYEEYYLKITLPYVLFGLSLLMAGQLEARGADRRELMTPLLISGLVSTIWHYYYGVKYGYGGTTSDIDTIRYQILSSSNILLFAYGMCSLCVNRKLNLFGVLAIFLSVGPVIISICRGYIVIGGLITVVLLVYLFYQSKQMPALRTRLATRLIIFCVALVLTIGVVLVIRPNTFDTWQQRMTVRGGVAADPDAIIRMAEVSWDWNAIKSNPQYLLTGKGIGSTYSHDQAYDAVLGQEGVPTGLIPFPADCTWSYVFYTSGLLFGAMMLAIFFMPVIRAARILFSKRERGNVEKNFVLLISFTALVGCLAGINTSAEFMDRDFSLIMGFLVAIVYWKYRPYDGVQARSLLGL